MGRYRAKCVEEQIDIEALSLIASETNESLRLDLGITASDMQAFRCILHGLK